MQVRAATEDDVRAVCAALRFDDIEAARGLGVTIDDLTENIVGSLKSAVATFALCDQAGPVAIVGVERLRPGVVNIQRVANDRWDGVLRGAIKWWRREFAPAVLARERLALCQVSALDRGARYFAASLGFVRLAPPLPWGVNGENFFTFAWINRDVQENLQ